MKKIRCKQCKVKFQPAARGRRSLYCSAACRQKAYRRRAGRPVALRVLESDLFAIKDLAARERAAVRFLNDRGYEVHFTRSTSRPQQVEARSARGRLRVVKTAEVHEGAADALGASAPATDGTK
jgi:hypothetical protein